jgi:hypothetical protein
VGCNSVGNKNLCKGNVKITINVSNREFYVKVILMELQWQIKV